MKKTIKRLRIFGETVRALGARELGDVDGGLPTSHKTCDDTTWTLQANGTTGDGMTPPRPPIGPKFQ